MDNNISLWLGKFLFKRGRLLEPDGRELYRYRVNEREFNELEQLLRELIVSISPAESLTHLSKKQYFCQLFVLYCAEWWRRRYDGAGFSWDPIVRDLNGNPAAWSHQQRSGCVEWGFRLWKVQLRQHGGLRYMISVALQGGLPVRLLAEGRGAVGQVLKRVLSLASSATATQQDIEEWVASLQNRLPLSYRQPAIYLLLADIVITVLRLKQEADLVESGRAIAQLNERTPDWRERFPLPIEDEHAQSLIAQLLCEAVTLGKATSSVLFPLKRQLEKKGILWNVFSVVDCPGITDAKTLAKFFNIALDDLPQHAELTLRAGEQRNSVRIRRLAGQEKYRLERVPWELQGTHATKNHTLELSAPDGRVWNAIASRGEELDDELPWLFSTADAPLFLRQGGGKVAESEAFLAPPQGYFVHPDQESHCEEQGSLSEISRKLWKIRGTVQVRNEIGETYKISTNRAEVSEETYAWQGKRLWYDFLSPSQAFLGQPRLYRVLPEGSQRPVDGQPHFSCPGNSMATSSRGPVIARYSVNGELRWRSRMVLLPEDAQLTMDSKSGLGGTLSFRNWGAVNGRLLTPGVDMETRREGNHTLSLNVKVAEEGRAPETLELEIYWPHTTCPVRMALPFPAKGVRAFSGDGAEWKNRTKVTIQQLLGSRIIVHKSRNDSHVALQLRTNQDQSIRTFVLHALPNSLHITLRPLDYLEDIQHLLASNDNLDALVTLEIIVDGGGQFRLDVARYAAHLKQQDNMVAVNDSARAKLAAGLLATPSIRAINLVQVGNITHTLPLEEGEHGKWSFDPHALSPGPWLLYPDPESPLAIRPLLWPVEGEIQAESNIAKAIGISTTVERQRALSEVVNELASDFLNPNWGEVEQLIGKLSHLPLTSLDICRALARSAKGMAALALRLGGVPFEYCRRFSLELPFTWEAVHYSAWKNALTALAVQYGTMYGEEAGKAVMRIHLTGVCDKIAADYPSLQYVFGIMRAGIDPEAQQDTLALRFGLGPQAKVWLFEGDDCHLQKLLRHHSEDEWPTGCEHVLRQARMNDAFSSYLCPVSYGFRDPVINLPLLLAVQCATGESQAWLQDSARIRLLRTCRSFDPDWFAEAFNLTIARCFADGLLD